MMWKYNDRCLWKNRRATITKIYSERCTLNVCEGPGGDISSWKTRKNIPLSQLEPLPQPARFDAEGFLIEAAGCGENQAGDSLLSPGLENQAGDSPLSPGLENQAGGQAADDSPLSPGLENQAGAQAADDSPLSPGLENQAGGQAADDSLLSPGLENQAGDSPLSPGLENQAGGQAADDSPLSPGLENQAGGQAADDSPLSPGLENQAGGQAADDSLLSPGGENQAGGQAADDSLLSPGGENQIEVIEGGESFVGYHGQVTTYKPKGSARADTEYFCYRYTDTYDGRRRHIHIKGGNSANPVAQARALHIEAMIRRGKLPTEIVQVIKSWSKSATKH